MPSYIIHTVKVYALLMFDFSMKNGQPEKTGLDNRKRDADYYLLV